MGIDQVAFGFNKFFGWHETTSLAGQVCASHNGDRALDGVEVSPAALKLKKT